MKYLVNGVFLKIKSFLEICHVQMGLFMSRKPVARKIKMNKKNKQHTQGHLKVVE